MILISDRYKAYVNQLFNCGSNNGSVWIPETNLPCTTLGYRAAVGIFALLEVCQQHGICHLPQCAAGCDYRPGRQRCGFVVPNHSLTSTVCNRKIYLLYNDRPLVLIGNTYYSRSYITSMGCPSVIHCV